MGLDLTLVLIKNASGNCKTRKEMHNREARLGGMWLGFDRISLSRAYATFSYFGATRAKNDEEICVKTWLLPEHITFYNYGDEGIEEGREDPYGTPLTYTTCGEIKRVFNQSKSLQERPDEWNHIFIRALMELPEIMPVVLYWH